MSKSNGRGHCRSWWNGLPNDETNETPSIQTYAARDGDTVRAVNAERFHGIHNTHTVNRYKTTDKTSNSIESSS